jgi:predicted Rossmann fold nucleotide-binding protein DprA/Smf involved in DNA uptake
MPISLDSQVILLLCSRLGLPAEPEFSPFTLKDWNPLVLKLQSEAMRPGDLLELDLPDIQSKLKLSDEESTKIFRLLQRSGPLAIELERLGSLGINVVTRADKEYPERYKQRLKGSSPPILFYSGEKALLGQPGIAVIGSRRLDDAGQACADFVGNACGISGLVLYSGGAKGVDTISMKAALYARGTAVGILADSLEKAIRDPENRVALSQGNLCLVTPYSPNAPFSVGTAMGRNKLIYALADHAIVVASDVEKGGTWAGATDALKAKWIPIFVLDHPDMPDGNKQLMKKGAIPFPHPFTEDRLKLKEWLDKQSLDQNKAEAVIQPGLFSDYSVSKQDALVVGEKKSKKYDH